MNKLAIFAALAAPVILSSCSDKGYWDEYVPADVEYAIITANLKCTLNPDLKTIAPFTILVTRGTTVGDVSLPVTVTTQSAYVTASAPATVDFVNGSSEAYYTITFNPDFDNAPWFNPSDTITVTLGTDNVAPSGRGEWKAAVDFANSVKLGTAKLTSQLLGYIKNGGTPGSQTVVEESVNVWSRADNPYYLMIENPYGDHALDLVLDQSMQAIDWAATDAVCDMQTILNTPDTKAPVYLKWDGQDSQVSDAGMVLKFFTVSNADGTGYWPSQYQWVETYEMPEGWNVVSE